MTDFGDILRRGRRNYNIKQLPSEWGRCDACGERKLLHPYDSEKKEIWMLCEECSDVFVKEETE